MQAGNTGEAAQRDRALNAAADTALAGLLVLKALACPKGFVPNFMHCNSSFLGKKGE